MSTPPHLRLPAGAHAGLLATTRGDFAVYDAVPSPGTTRLGSAVLVPGFTGSKEDFITLLAPLTQAGYRVLAIDQRGQFETPGPDDPDAYDLAELGADLIAIGATTDESVHLVGHSFGGLAVRAATVAAPEAVRSATLLCSGPGALTGPSADRLGMLLGALEMFSVADIWDIIQASAQASGENDGVEPDVLDFLRRRFVGTTKQSLRVMASQLLAAPDRVAELAAAAVPVLVAWGVDDDVWRPPVQAEMAARLGARAVAVEGAGHSPAVQNPGRTAQVLLEFWDEVRAPAKVERIFGEGP
ncbi:MAG TPA: alpha/beta hydrolase [Sporichthyaceae bacterium]|nr:alpha/beta hydrolase [Sporichthyaceae bacterium]